MKKFLIPLCVILFFVSAVMLWYFGHHLPTQDALNVGSKQKSPDVGSKEVNKVVSVPANTKETHPPEVAHTQMDQTQPAETQDTENTETSASSEQSQPDHDHSHEPTPEYEASIQEAAAYLAEQTRKAEEAETQRIAAERRREEAERRALPTIKSTVSRLNSLPAEKQRIYWEGLRIAIEEQLRSTDSQYDTEPVDADEIVQALIDILTENGYQQKY